MLVESTVKPDKVQRIGGNTLVNFLVREKLKINNGTEEIIYEYQQAILQADAQDSDIDKVIETESKKILEAEKKLALDAIKVTISSGKVIYGDEKSRIDINDAINLSQELGTKSTTWKLAEPYNGSKITIITIDELKEARRLALEEKARIIGVVA